MRYFVLVVALAFSSLLAAQLVSYPTYVGDGTQLRRLFRLTDAHTVTHAALGPYTFSDVQLMVEAVDSLQLASSAADQAAVLLARQRLAGVEERPNPGKTGFLGWVTRSFYRQPAYALAYHRPNFELYANPVFFLSTGRQSDGDVAGGTSFVNTRGLSVQGSIDGKVFFSTSIYENQLRLRSWEREWSTAYNRRVPGAGFVKDYDPILFDVPDARDFIQARGELGFNVTKHISFRFGHGNPRIGSGIRTQILDDFADPYLYGQIDTRIWRIHYRNVFSQFQDGVPNATDFNRKFSAAHTLSLKLAPQWELGITETIVFSRENGFDAQYLNPIILYRAVEGDNGSPDNSLFSVHTDLGLGKRAAVFGQFTFDEFKFDELFQLNRGWWANKFGWQVGGELFDPLGINGLHLRGEYNLVRPFTYGHRREGLSFTHYDQPLAHPWGSSLSEWVVDANYELGKWLLSARLNVLTQDDVSAPPEPHLGANVLYSNGLRGRDFQYEVAGESPVDRTYGRLGLTYRPFAGASLFGHYEYYGRNRTGTGAEEFSQHGVRIGFTMNAIERSGVF